jgi:hypothetical protein
LVLETNERRSKSRFTSNADVLKPADLLKMITTPVEKQRAKSYYLGPHNPGRHHDDNKSLGNHSVRVDQRKRSKHHRKDKNKSLERDLTNNNSKYFKNTNKSVKKVSVILFRINRQANQ